MADHRAVAVSVQVVETHDEWQVAERRYLSEESMADLASTGRTEPIIIPEVLLPVLA